MTITRDPTNPLDAFCLSIIQDVRKRADSQLQLADSLIHSVTFNRHSLDSEERCRSLAGRSRQRALALQALADVWEADGIPAGYPDLIKTAEDLTT